MDRSDERGLVNVAQAQPTYKSVSRTPATFWSFIANRTAVDAITLGRGLLRDLSDINHQFRVGPSNC